MKKSTRHNAVTKFFDGRAPSFDESPWATDERIVAAFEKPLQWRQPHMVLDLGGGTGILASMLRERLQNSIFVNFDISFEMLRRSKARCIPSVVADISSLPVASDTVDAILLRQVIHYLDDPAVAIRECARVLRQGALLLVGQFIPYDETDRQWMNTISGVWQAFATTFPTQNELGQLIANNGFKVTASSECTVTESVARWLNRFSSVPADRQREIWSLFHSAADQKTERKLWVQESDILFENRFMLVEAISM